MWADGERRFEYTMRLGLFRMEIEGKVAMANLCLFALVLAALLIGFPGGIIDHGTTSEETLGFADVLWIILVVLSFPVGWLSSLFAGVSGPPITAVIFVPLNAYLWGYIVGAVMRRLKPRSERADLTDGASSS